MGWGEGRVQVVALVAFSETDREAFRDVANQFTDAGKAYAFTPAIPKDVPKPDSAIDAAALAQGRTRRRQEAHRLQRLSGRVAAATPGSGVANALALLTRPTPHTRRLPPPAIGTAWRR